MTDQLLKSLVVLETEVNALVATEPCDIERLSNIIAQHNLLPSIEELTDSVKKRQLLLRLQQILNDVTICLVNENKQISNQLEKFQLAKKGAARYHDMQKP